jgi:hypothetical protein
MIHIYIYIYKICFGNMVVIMRLEAITAKTHQQNHIIKERAKRENLNIYI